MNSPSDKEGHEECFAEPETAISCFYNSILGYMRKWPRAYSCLSAAERERFESRGGISAFADYWEDTLSFLEELVKKRHKEYPYRHRSCFSMDNVVYESVGATQAAVTLELLENHLSRERLVVVQRKELLKDGDNWLLKNGELEGKLNDIIVVRNLRLSRYVSV